MDFDQEIEEILELACNMKEIKVIKEQVLDGKEIVIFGAGNCGHTVWRSLLDEGIKVKAFCDNRLAGTTDRETSLPIISVMQMAEDLKQYFIPVSVADRPVYAPLFGSFCGNGLLCSISVFDE